MAQTAVPYVNRAEQCDNPAAFSCGSNQLQVCLPVNHGVIMIHENPAVNAGFSWRSQFAEKVILAANVTIRRD
jgi:hypothetical protein